MGISVYYYDDMVPRIVSAGEFFSTADLDALGIDGLIFPVLFYGNLKFEIETCVMLKESGKKVLHRLHLNQVGEFWKGLLAEEPIARNCDGVVLDTEGYFHKSGDNFFHEGQKLSMEFFTAHPSGELGVMHAGEYDVCWAPSTGGPQYKAEETTDEQGNLAYRYLPIDSGYMEKWTDFFRGILFGLHNVADDDARVILFIERTYQANSNQIAYCLDELNYGTVEAVKGYKDIDDIWGGHAKVVLGDERFQHDGIAPALLKCSDKTYYHLWTKDSRIVVAPGMWPLGSDTTDDWSNVSLSLFEEQISTLKGIGPEYAWIFGRGTAWLNPPTEGIEHMWHRKWTKPFSDYKDEFGKYVNALKNL